MVQNVLTTKDFDNILNNYFGMELIHIPVTKTTSNKSGKETLTEGAPVFIKAYFQRAMKSWIFDRHGKVEGGDAVLCSKYADDVTTDNMICTLGTPLTITSVDGGAATITVSTSASHGLAVNDKVIIQGTTNYDGYYTVAGITDADTFTITDASHNLAEETAGTCFTKFEEFRVREQVPLKGVFDSTGPDSTYTYTQSNLFLDDDSDA